MGVITPLNLSCTSILIECESRCTVCPALFITVTIVCVRIGGQLAHPYPWKSPLSFFKAVQKLRPFFEWCNSHSILYIFHIKSINEKIKLCCGQWYKPCVCTLTRSLLPWAKQQGHSGAVRVGYSDKTLACTYLLCLYWLAQCKHMHCLWTCERKGWESITAPLSGRPNWEVTVAYCCGLLLYTW